MKASPYARKLAAEAGVDVSQATPTGPEARIVAVDVQKLIESGGGKPAPAVAEAGDAKPRPAAQDVDTPSGADVSPPHPRKHYCLAAVNVEFDLLRERVRTRWILPTCGGLPCDADTCLLLHRERCHHS